MKLNEAFLFQVEAVARAAGEAIMAIYTSDFAINEKEDRSPLTEADIAAHILITQALQTLTPDIPIFSEEAVETFSGPNAQEQYWLVDPLDGTKEFIKKNGEFTVNIALVEQGKPVLGIVYAPALDVLYSAAEGLGAFKADSSGAKTPIQVAWHTPGTPWKVVGSRSHAGDSLKEWLKTLGEYELIPMGSSLKFCLVAEGKADIYPRLGPTSLWDTAAAQCVVEQAGGEVTDLEGNILGYGNIARILNPPFVVKSPSKTKILKIIILSDGKAGHVSSSRGMAQLIAQKTPSEIQILEVRLRVKFLRPFLRVLINSSLACRLTKLFGDGWPSLFYRGYRRIHADAIISAGGDTIYLNAYAGRCLGIPNFFCGSMRGVDPNLFSLIVHTRHAPIANWLAMAVLPIAMDLEKVAQTAETFVKDHLWGQRKNLWALLIGGTIKGYDFSDAQILAMLEQCTSIANRHGKTLLITTSRRTGRSAENVIANWLEEHPDAPIAYTVLYGRQPEKVADIFMQLAEIIFCSEESGSMISESVYCGRPVVALAPSNSTPTPDKLNFLERLESRLHIRRMLIDPTSKHDALEEFQETWREYDRGDHRKLQDLLLAKIHDHTPIP